ncbi:MAG: MFS transporter [Nanoarchaeota archaeon]|nr:MFS transporter [Nanoarchaeota archaeon]
MNVSEWSLYSTGISVGTAITAAVGAAMAEFVGFTITFLVMGIMSLTGCGILFFLYKKSRPHKVKEKIKDYPKRSKAANGANGKY